MDIWEEAVDRRIQGVSPCWIQGVSPSFVLEEGGQTPPEREELGEREVNG